MTLATLQSISSQSNIETEPLAPVGTDEAEYLKWEAYLKASGQGEVLEQLSNDDAEFFGDFLPQQPE